MYACWHVSMQGSGWASVYESEALALARSDGNDCPYGPAERGGFLDRRCLGRPLLEGLRFKSMVLHEGRAFRAGGLGGSGLKGSSRSGRRIAELGRPARLQSAQAQRSRGF
jgi:hypothetical protein